MDKRLNYLKTNILNQKKLSAIKDVLNDKKIDKKETIRLLTQFKQDNLPNWEAGHTKYSHLYILAVQHALKELGMFDKNRDGIYGPETGDAVEAFQKEYNLYSF